MKRLVREEDVDASSPSKDIGSSISTPVSSSSPTSSSPSTKKKKTKGGMSPSSVDPLDDAELPDEEEGDLCSMDSDVELSFEEMEGQDDEEEEEEEDYDPKQEAADYVEPVGKAWNPLAAPLKDNEELVCAPGTYELYHTATTPWPCLSFDFMNINKSNIGTYPIDCWLVGGTQADKETSNEIYIMHWSTLHKTINDGLESDDFVEDEEVVEGDPVFQIRTIPHKWGTINKIRSCPQLPRVVSTWGEDGTVRLWDVNDQIESLSDNASTKLGRKDPIYEFKQGNEGFAMNFSPLLPGTLATGDNNGDIHIHTPAGKLKYTTSEAYKGHTSSVESISWKSGGEGGENIFASGGSDSNICVWDIRTGYKPVQVQGSCHQGDINVIHFNPHAAASNLLLSGGDDGVVKVWDTRTMTAGAVLNAHKDAISDVRWSPHEASALASSAYDDVLYVWDLSVEKADEKEVLSLQEESSITLPEEVMFDHRGQREICEIGWHPYIDSCLVSSSSSNFNIFKPRNLA